MQQFWSIRGKKVLCLHHLFFVDFHQTIQKTLTGFFIFGYRRSALHFAKLINTELPIVTHWGTSFSQNGLCSDEYVNKNSGLGITIELGAISPTFDSDQYELGVKCALSAIERVTQYLNLSPLPLNVASLNTNLPLSTEEMIQGYGQLYTWAHIEPWPVGHSVELETGLVNFKDINKGDIYASIDGKPLCAPTSGKILFPKYLSASKQKELESSGQLPKELIRIARPIVREELPENPL